MTVKQASKTAGGARGRRCIHGCGRADPAANFCPQCGALLPGSRIPGEPVIKALGTSPLAREFYGAAGADPAQREMLRTQILTKGA